MRRELMQTRMDTMYVRDYRGRLLTQNQWDGGRAPRFVLGRAKDGVVTRFRNDVPTALVRELDSLAAREPLENELEIEPAYAKVYRELLDEHAAVAKEWRGPTYICERDLATSKSVVAMSRDQVQLLNGGLEDWIPDVPHRTPFCVSVVDDRAVAVCASVRIGANHEAGVETLVSHRRQGHASAVTGAWCNAVRALGAVPSYSTSWDNVASQKVAEGLGMSLLGFDYWLT